VIPKTTRSVDEMSSFCGAFKKLAISSCAGNELIVWCW
jgi:hypothetical protein